MKLMLILAVTILALSVNGCSSSGAFDKSSAQTYTANLGTATHYDFRDKTRKMLDRFQFYILRYEQTTDATFFETDWKIRYPFEDEILDGIEEARTRLIITANPRTRVPIGPDLQTVRMEAENQIRYRHSADWHYKEMSPMLKGYLRDFADKLSTEFRTGIRQY
jgi:hypothetical protein